MLEGRRFAERVTRETGPHGLLAQLVENPPDSTWEIHAPEEYLARVRAERAAAPPTALAAR